MVVVTGGSEGLGLAIVNQFSDSGATVVSVARNQAKNEAAMSDTNTQAFQGDVTDDESVKNVVARIIAEFGRIDVWVNNVGKSTRANVMEVNVDEYRDFMEMNFYSAVRCWNACKSHLESSSGSLVNIGSLASKTGWPLMAPYSTSKHALSAFSHQLRLEAPKNIHVLHFCPGPIQRSDSGRRYDELSEGLSEQAKTAGAGAPVKRLPPDKVAKAIVVACEKRKGEVVMPWKARILFAVSQLSTSLGDKLLRRSVKK